MKTISELALEVLEDHARADTEPGEWTTVLAARALTREEELARALLDELTESDRQKQRILDLEMFVRVVVIYGVAKIDELSDLLDHGTALPVFTDDNRAVLRALIPQ